MEEWNYNLQDDWRDEPCWTLVKPYVCVYVASGAHDGGYAEMVSTYQQYVFFLTLQYFWCWYHAGINQNILLMAMGVI